MSPGRRRSDAARPPRAIAESRRLQRDLALPDRLRRWARCSGVAIGTALGWGNAPTIAARDRARVLFGYAFTAVPLLRSGLALGAAAGIAFAADTISIAVMEIVDNAVLLVVPGAMEAGLDDPLFWGSLAFALAVAFVAAYPVNRWLIARGRGHAVVHSHH